MAATDVQLNSAIDTSMVISERRDLGMSLNSHSPPIAISMLSPCGRGFVLFRKLTRTSRAHVARSSTSYKRRATLSQNQKWSRKSPMHTPANETGGDLCTHISLQTSTRSAQ